MKRKVRGGKRVVPEKTAAPEMATGKGDESVGNTATRNYDRVNKIMF